jgi:hypothetical protein
MQFVACTKLQHHSVQGLLCCMRGHLDPSVEWALTRSKCHVCNTGLCLTHQTPLRPVHTGELAENLVQQEAIALPSRPTHTDGTKGPWDALQDTHCLLPYFPAASNFIEANQQQLALSCLCSARFGRRCAASREELPRQLGSIVVLLSTALSHHVMKGPLSLSVVC